MEDDGNLIDVAGLAIRILLSNITCVFLLFRIPAVKITEVDDIVELDIDPDPSKYSKLEFKVLPFVITAYKIGSTFFFDPTTLETACVEVSVTFGICPSSKSVYNTFLGMVGSVSMSELGNIIKVFIF